VTFQTGETRSSTLSGFTIGNTPAAAIYFNNSSGTIVNDIVTNSDCAIVAVGSSASPAILQNDITGNTGGPAYTPGKGQALKTCIPSNQLYDRFIQPGAGITGFSAGDLQITGNVIENNGAYTTASGGQMPSGGGAINVFDLYASTTTLLANNNIIRNNLATDSTLNVQNLRQASIIQNLVYGNSTVDGSAGISVSSMSGVVAMAVANNTSYGNVLYQSTQVPDNYGEQAEFGGFFDPYSIENSLFIGTNSIGIVECYAPPNNPVPYTYANNDAFYAGGTPPPLCSSSGTSNLETDPQFLNPAAGDFHTQRTSPVVGAGNINTPGLPPTDLDGKNRTVCGSVDMGVYQIHPIPPIALASSPNPSVGGSPVTLSVQLTGNCNIPTGLITFLDGNTTLGTATLSSTASASFSTASLTVGTHTLTATYPGDFNFDPSTSIPVTQVVTGYPTATTLAAAPNPATALQTIALSSNVSSNFGTPNGTVTFYANSTPLATAPLDPNGHAQATVSTLGAGTWPLTAVYNPSILFASSTSPIVTEVIDGATTATTLTSAPNPSTFGQPVTFTAAVTAPQSTAIPTGTVTFRDSSNPAGTVTLGQSTLNASGIATLSISTLSVGTHTISAVYSGSANDNPSTSLALAQIVVSAPVSIALTADPNPANQGQRVSLAVTVSATGTPAPTGSVAFLDTFQGQTTTLATATLVNGQAAFSTSTLALGTHSLTAVFAASGNYAAGTSNTVSELIQSHDFSIVLAPGSIVSAAGPHLHIAVALTSLGSYTGTLTLTAAPLPQYSGATFSPATLTLAPGQTANSTLTLATSQLPPGIARDASRIPTAVWAATLFLPLLLVRRRPIQRLAATLIAAALLSVATGCTTISYPLNLLAPGTYIIPVTATDPSTGIAHTANLSITITQ
jgi:hypothetical protein